MSERAPNFRYTAPADRWGERMPRTLGLWGAVAVLVGTTIGSGIFRVPATVAMQLNDPGVVLLAWLLGGLITLCGALTIAELASMMPRSGGIFAYLLEGFGPLPAFLMGWSEITVIRASALGGIATIFAEYCGHFVVLNDQQVRYVAAATILSVAFINYVGLSRASCVMNVATVLKFAALAAIGVLAFAAGNGSVANFSASSPASGNIGFAGLSLLATALIPIMWTYDGWANLSFVGGEVKQPERMLPRALIIGTSAIILIYALVNLAFIYLVPLPEMLGTRLVAAVAAERIPVFAGWGATIVAVVVIISTFGALNGSIMTGPRICFAMADRGLFLRGLARVSPRFQTPSTAIWTAATLGVIYVLHNDFAQLADRFILGIWPFYILAVAAVFVLRKRHPQGHRPYRTWGYPFVPAFFLLASVGLVANALWTDPVNTSITFGIVLAGVPIYFLWKRINRESYALKDHA